MRITSPLELRVENLEKLRAYESVAFNRLDRRIRNLEGVAWLTVVWALTFTAWAWSR